MAPSQCELSNHVTSLQEKTNLWLSKDDAESRESLRQAALKIASALEPPVEISDRLSYEPIVAMCLNVALDGKWLEYLAQHEGPVSASKLCEGCGGSPDFVVRIMRILVLHNIVDEHDIEEYSANDATHYLIGKAILDSTQHIYPLHARAYLELPQWAKENNYEEPKDLENGPFASAFKKTFWEVLEEDPTANAAFTHSMDWFYDEKITERDADFLHNDLANIFPSENDALTLVDIGGGSGAFIKTVRSRYPDTKGRLITQDRSSVVEVGRQKSNPDGIEFLGYDFFTPQPIKGANGYSLRHIIHDWPDEPSRKILHNTAMSMEKHSRFYIFDMIVPDKGYSAATAFHDMLMMLTFSGKERTRKQWDKLLVAAGLRLVDAIVFDKNTGLGVIVAALPA